MSPKQILLIGDRRYQDAAGINKIVCAREAITGGGGGDQNLCLWANRYAVSTERKLTEHCLT